MAYWRDIHRSQPVEITPPSVEPMSLTEAKHQLQIEADQTDFDPWLTRRIPAARQQVEHDLDLVLVQSVLEQWVDAFPEERFIPLRGPVISVAYLKSTDRDNVETTMDSGGYFVDTASRPGRIILNASASWPSSVREFNAGRIRWTAGHSGASVTVSGITRSSSTATATTSAAHGFSTGQRITIAGADQSAYNGTFEITVTGATTFTFTVTGSPATPGTGAMTATNLGVPERYMQAMAVLLAHWFANREAVQAGIAPASELPLAYCALIADRVVGMG